MLFFRSNFAFFIADLARLLEECLLAEDHLVSTLMSFKKCSNVLLNWGPLVVPHLAGHAVDEAQELKLLCD